MQETCLSGATLNFLVRASGGGSSLQHPMTPLARCPALSSSSSAGKTSALTQVCIPIHLVQKLIYMESFSKQWIPTRNIRE